MGAATLLMVSLAQLFSIRNETSFEFCKNGDNQEIEIVDNRMAFFVASPAYPKPYTAGKDCSFNFKIPINETDDRTYSVYLSCVEAFQMQERPGGDGTLSSAACGDFLQVDEMTACGNELQEVKVHHMMMGPIKSNGLLLRFKSDTTNSEDNKGFRCHGIIDAKKSCSQTIYLQLPDRNSEIIEGVRMKRMDKAIISCLFMIKVDPGYHVKMTFLEFNLDTTDGEYCLTIGGNPENSYCSSAENGKARWPPASLVVEPHNGVLKIRLSSVSLSVVRGVSLEKHAFVAEVMLHRGKENAGSASHLIFPDPNYIGKGSKSSENGVVFPKPPQGPNKIYRQMMVPIPSPGPKDSCMCWEFPPENVFLSLMAMGARM